MSITVEQVLQLDILQNSHIAAGANGLTRSVSAISVIEAPDIVDWIYGGEILLTTLYSVMQAHLSVELFFEQLCKKGISALMVKTGRSIDTLPSEMLKLADQYQVPLIELEIEVRYIDILSQGMQLLLNNQTKKLNHYLQVQNQLTNLMINGANVEETIRFVSKQVDAAIQLQSSSHQVISQTYSEDEFGLQPNLQTFPIICFHKTAGYLIAGSWQPLREEQRIILENACNLIAMEFLKKMYAQEIEQKYLNDFLDDLFSKPWQFNGFAEKLARYGFAENGYYQVVEIHLQLPSSVSLEEKNSIYAAVLSTLFSSQNQLVRIYDGILKILCYFPSKEHIQTIGELISAKMDAFKDELCDQNLTVPGLVIGISSCTQQAQTILKCAQQAAICIHYASILHHSIVCYESLGILQLFNMYPDAQQLQQVIPQSVLVLSAYDQQNHSQYIETLDMYFEQNCNLSNTAKVLFIHYKTLLHRMERIKQIAGIFLDDPAQKLEVQLGIKLYQLLNRAPDHRE